jgi:N-methylhydantoinase B
MPDRCAAGHHASFGSYGFFGQHPDTGAFFTFFDTVHGGWGATASGDGIGPYKTMLHGDNRDIPIEVQEALYPVQIESYAWRPDSAGPGQHRGGLGTIKSYLVTTPCTAQFAFERYGCPPWGLFGGQSGTPGWVEVERKDAQRGILLKESDLPMAAGDRLHVFAGGGGGYGASENRNRNAVQADLDSGLITEEHARTAYGLGR